MMGKQTSQRTLLLLLVGAFVLHFASSLQQDLSPPWTSRLRPPTLSDSCLRKDSTKNQLQLKDSPIKPDAQNAEVNHLSSQRLGGQHLQRTNEERHLNSGQLASRGASEKRRLDSRRASEERRLDSRRASEERLDSRRTSEERRLDSRRASEERRLDSRRASEERLDSRRASEERRLDSRRASEERRLDYRRASEERRLDSRRASEERLDSRRASEERRLDSRRASEERRLDSRRASEERVDSRRASEERRLDSRRASEERRLDSRRASEERRMDSRRASEERVDSRRASEERRRDSRRACEGQRLDSRMLVKGSRLDCANEHFRITSKECQTGFRGISGDHLHGGLRMNRLDFSIHKIPDQSDTVTFSAKRASHSIIENGEEERSTSGMVVKGLWTGLVTLALYHTRHAPVSKLAAC